MHKDETMVNTVAQLNTKYESIILSFEMSTNVPNNTTAATLSWLLTAVNLLTFFNGLSSRCACCIV